MAHSFKLSEAPSLDISHIEVEGRRRFSVTMGDIKVGFDVSIHDTVTATVELRPPIIISWIRSPTMNDAIPKATKVPTDVENTVSLKLFPEPKSEDDEDKVNRLACLDFSKRVISTAIAQAAAPSSPVDQEVLNVVAMRFDNMMKTVDKQITDLKRSFLENDEFRNSVEYYDKGIFSSFKLEF